MDSNGFHYRRKFRDLSLVVLSSVALVRHYLIDRDVLDNRCQPRQRRPRLYLGSSSSCSYTDVRNGLIVWKRIHGHNLRRCPQALARGTLMTVDLAGLGRAAFETQLRASNPEGSDERLPKIGEPMSQDFQTLLRRQELTTKGEPYSKTATGSKQSKRPLPVLRELKDEHKLVFREHRPIASSSRCQCDLNLLAAIPMDRVVMRSSSRGIAQDISRFRSNIFPITAQRENVDMSLKSQAFIRHEIGLK